MSQGGPRLRCRTGLSSGPAPRAVFQFAAAFVASVAAHATVVAALTGRSAAPRVAAEPAAAWIDAPEPVNIDPGAPAEAEEEGPAVPAPPTAQTREPAALPPSDEPPGVINLAEDALARPDARGTSDAVH